jgi:D-alanyl-D-alanine endopeptidase (penicillin-binding protein 7)
LGLSIPTIAVSTTTQNKSDSKAKKSVLKEKKDTAPKPDKKVVKKAEKRAKSPKQVRTTVIGRANAEPGAHLSFGAALGLARSRDDLNLKSSVSIIVDQRTQDVLFEKNPSAVLPIASITKLMTAMVVLDAKQPMDEMLVINDEDAHIYNHSRLAAGTELTRREAMLLALMSSENRAAYTLGRNYPGGIAAFIPAMNRKAREIGMVNSKFADPTGLTNQNASTAEDLARMVNAAYQYPTIREFSTNTNYTKIIKGRPQEFISSNRLVRSGDMEIGLQKTGYIADAGRCLVMQASIKGRPVIMVFLDSAGKLSRFADAVRVKEWIEEGGDVKALRRIGLEKSGATNSASAN